MDRWNDETFKVMVVLNHFGAKSGPVERATLSFKQLLDWRNDRQRIHAERIAKMHKDAEFKGNKEDWMQSKAQS